MYISVGEVISLVYCGLWTQRQLLAMINLEPMQIFFFAAGESWTNVQYKTGGTIGAIKCRFLVVVVETLAFTMANTNIKM